MAEVWAWSLQAASRTNFHNKNQNTLPLPAVTNLQTDVTIVLHYTVNCQALYLNTISGDVLFRPLQDQSTRGKRSSRCLCRGIVLTSLHCKQEKTTSVHTRVLLVFLRDGRRAEELKELYANVSASQHEGPHHSKVFLGPNIQRASND